MFLQRLGLPSACFCNRLAQVVCAWQPVGMEIKQPHCQECRSTAAEDIETTDGYTRCCNERVQWFGCQPDDCFHD